jgi:hypothetical protein
MPAWRGPAVALVDTTSDGIFPGLLAALASALQTQVDRDLLPVWGIGASIAPIRRGGGPPRSAWSIRMVDPDVTAGGEHLDVRGAPFAVVGVDEGWTATASHELLEMLGDPWRRRFLTAPSIEPAAAARPVHYLVEIADPCEPVSYMINGVQVSDFVTPAYYGGGRGPFDLLGRLSRPLEVPPGGSLSWVDPYDRRWHRKRPDGEIVTGEPARRAAHATADRDAALAGVS